MGLIVESLGKQYANGAWALRDLNFEHRAGLIGVLGPDGAGKSTLMRILATIASPTRGRVIWNGEDARLRPERLRSQLGYLPQDFGVYPELTAPEFLHYMAAAKGMSRRQAQNRIDDLLRLLGLDRYRGLRLSAYSGGMKQRVGIAQSLLSDPRLLLLDEPTSGLDPEERARFRELIIEPGSERLTLFSTHVVSDIEGAASWILLLRNGELLTHEQVPTLIAGLQGRVWRVCVPTEELDLVRAALPAVSSISHGDGMTTIRCVSERLPIADAVVTEPRLEDVYFWTACSVPAALSAKDE